MGATAFFVIMLGALIMGIIWLAAGVICLCLRKRGKIFKIIGSVLTVLGVISILIPVGWVIFLRSENSWTGTERIDTGIEVEWEDEEKQSFEYAGNRYVAVQYRDDMFYDVTSEEVQGEPVFNMIKYPEDIWEKIFVGKEKTVIYQVENGAGVTTYYDGYSLYCSEEDVEALESYYHNLDNYNWYLEIYPEDYDEEKVQMLPLTLSGEEADAVQGMVIFNLDISLEIPENGGYECLARMSKDGVVKGAIYLQEDDGTWYWNTEMCDESKSTDEKWYCYVVKLPKTVSEKINEVR